MTKNSSMDSPQSSTHSSTHSSTQELYNLYKNDIRAFVEDFLPHIITSSIPEFHEEMYRLLPTSQRLVIAAPRGFAKSYLCSFIYPLHCLLFQTRQDICIISASESLALELVRKIRYELENNRKIIGFFGDLRSPKWTESHLITNTNVNIRARGAGGQIRGFRPDCVILDDIETDESVISEDQRNKLRDWVFKACLNTLLPHGQFIWIGTIIHPLALLNEILEADNGWEKRKYRAYRDAKEEKGYELWADLWSHEKLQKRKKEIGSFAFASEYLNDPVQSEAQPIKANQIRYWTELPKQYSCVISVDPAYSDDSKADYKVASLIGIDQHNNRYLINYIRTHSPIGEFQDAIINMYLTNKHLLTSIGIPNSGVEKGFYQSFLKKCEGRRVAPPVMELKNTFTNSSTSVSKRNKGARIVAALQPLFESGKYYIHQNHIEAKEELLLINASKHDDLVDSMAYAEQLLQPVFFEDKKETDRNIRRNETAIKNYGMG